MRNREGQYKLKLFGKKENKPEDPTKGRTCWLCTHYVKGLYFNFCDIDHHEVTSPMEKLFGSNFTYARKCPNFTQITREQFLESQRLEKPSVVTLKIETWKCRYCGNVNPTTNASCMNCGANRQQ